MEIETVNEAYEAFWKTADERINLEVYIENLPSESCREYEQLKEEVKCLKEIEKLQKDYLGLLLDHLWEDVVSIGNGEKERRNKNHV
jgi:hypothetical protein